MISIRVVIADDHNLLRAGLRSLISNFAEVETVAEAADGHQALALVESLRPEILLADIVMPGLDGILLTERVVNEYPSTRVIILSMYHEEEYVRRAIAAGAMGYLLKDSNTEELEMALRAVAKGETYLSPSATKYLVTDYLKQVNREKKPPAKLTQRQQEVLKFIAQGDSTKSIARKLKISVKTVETHRTQLMERLDIHEVAGLVRYAIRIGLIKPED